MAEEGFVLHVRKGDLGPLSVALLVGYFFLGLCAQMEGVKSLTPFVFLFFAVLCGLAARKTLWGKVTVMLALLLTGYAFVAYYMTSWQVPPLAK